MIVTIANAPNVSKDNITNFGFGMYILLRGAEDRRIMGVFVAISSRRR
jgi:hypothetical protein